ncbi:MAG: signal peptidase I [Clostridia bacterium]|nr:signal peptidase I [Clostridia bacterium]
MKKVFKRIGFVFSIIAVVICAVIIFFNLTHIYYNVLGPSMSPTLNDGVISPTECIDAVMVSKIKSYTRGDIIVIDKNQTDGNGNEKYVIKRLIAIGGDKITVRFINGYYRIVLIMAGESEEKVLEEEYIKDLSINQKLNNKFKTLIASNIYNTEGDFLVLAEDEVFYLGDNRANSSDCSAYGPIKKEDVVGKVDYIIYGNTNAYGQVLKQFFGW